MKTQKIEAPARALSNSLNGLDVAYLRSVIAGVAADTKTAATRWRVATRWMGGARSDTQVSSCDIGGRQVNKDFTIRVDEPLELGGTNQSANPQEYLLAAMNACMTVGYVAACSLEGIRVEELRIETKGDIDLRGFLGLDASVSPGFDELEYTVYIKAQASPAQIEKVHDFVCRTSPIRFSLSQPVRLQTRLVVG
jgi:uncharacterized OsmC-like protein